MVGPTSVGGVLSAMQIKFNLCLLRCIINYPTILFQLPTEMREFLVK